MDNQNLPPTPPISAPVPVQNPPVENQPIPPAPTSRFPKKVLLLGVVISIVIVSLLGTAVLFMNKSNGIAKDSPEKKTAVSPVKKYQAEQWVPCDDVRQVLEENGTLYVGCNGGLLIVEKATGKVIDQVSMAQGLPDPTVTEFVKNGDMLYIGTQYGVLLYNLKTKEGKKITPEEGLVNGSNIKLALQGDTLWVGTFDGVSSYNLMSGAIKNYQAELGFGTTYGIGGIIATPDAIYVSIGSNAESSGGIARFDLKKQQWEQQHGVDGALYEFTDTGPIVYVNGWNNISIYNKEKGQKFGWSTLPEVKEKLQVTEDDLRFSVLGQDQNGLYISTKDSLNYYTPATGEIQKLDVPPEVFAGFAGMPMRMDHDTFWYEKEADGWLGWVNLKTNERGEVRLTDRPLAIKDVEAVVDGRPILSATDGIWEYESAQKKFTKLPVGLPTELSNSVVELKPLLGTTKALVTSITCGQGCSGSVMNLYDFATKTSTPLVVPAASGKKTNEELNVFGSLDNITYKRYDQSQGLILFRIDTPGPVDVTFDTKTSQWGTIPVSPTPTTDTNSAIYTITCNPVYAFTSSNNQFTGLPCLAGLENSDYRWDVAGNYETQNITQTTKHTQATEVLKLPLSATRTSPFTNKKETRGVGITQTSVIANALWLGTGNGLIRYLPQSKETLVLQGEDGLAGDSVTSFAVDQNTLWIATTGGLSMIQL